MSEPQLLSIQNLAPVRPTRAFLHEMACEAVEKMFRDEGQIPPTWWLATGTRVLMVGTPWENTPEKRVSQNFIRMLLEITGAQAYVFVSETWTAQVTKQGNSDEAELAFRARMDWIDQHGVIALPRDQREEVLMVASSGRPTRDQQMSRYVINSGDKKPWLGVRVDEEERDGTGPAFNLFQQPVDQRMMNVALSFLMAQQKQKH